MGDMHWIELVCWGGGEENKSLQKEWDLLLFNCLCCCFCAVLGEDFGKGGSVPGCRSCEEEDEEGLSSLLVPRLAEQGSLCPCADAVLVLAPAACRALWERSRSALVTRPALHSNEPVKWGCDSKNLRHTSPGVMLGSETMGLWGKWQGRPQDLTLQNL